MAVGSLQPFGPCLHTHFRIPSGFFSPDKFVLSALGNSRRTSACQPSAAFPFPAPCLMSTLFVILVTGVWFRDRSRQTALKDKTPEKAPCSLQDGPELHTAASNCSLLNHLLVLRPWLKASTGAGLLNPPTGAVSWKSTSSHKSLQFGSFNDRRVTQRCSISQKSGRK